MKQAYFLIALMALAALPCRAQAKPALFCDKLGTVYGIAFDAAGNLLAAGSEGDNRVVWTIDAKGEKSKYCDVKDPSEAMSAIGISVHSRFLADMAVDEAGLLWISTLLPSGSFVVGPEPAKTLKKVYLNTEYSMSLQEKKPPHGVAYDVASASLYIVTLGPRSAKSTDNVSRLAALPYDKEEGDYAGVFAGKKDDLRFIKNEGIDLPFRTIALAVAKGGPLYCVSESAIYKIEGDKAVLFKKVENLSLLAAVVGDKGILYISANFPGYEPGSPGGKGKVIAIAADGSQRTVTSALAEPLGLAFRAGRLFVADRATGGVWSIKP